MSWTNEAKTVAIARVAAELQIPLARRADLAWCPACNHRGHGSARTFATKSGDRWKCHRCNASGDVVDLVAVALTGEPLPRGHSQAAEEVRDWFASRGWCSAAEDRPAPVRREVPRTPPPGAEAKQELPPPPRAEVLALLQSCGLASEDPEVSAWLERRLGDGARDRRGLVGALPRDVVQPGWAKWRVGDGPRKVWRPWAELGYRVILPMFGPDGLAYSVRARHVGTPSPDDPKALPPIGCGYRGLVMACRVARMMLARGERPRSCRGPFHLVVTEGEPAFLMWCMSSKVDAVLGVVSGSWTAELAARIPDRTHVTIATDHDKKGELYASKIVSSLQGRCRLARWSPPRELTPA